MRTRTRVCCRSSRTEAKVAIECGADVLGLVGPMPSGPRVIDAEAAAPIAAAVPPPIASFLLTAEVDAATALTSARVFAWTEHSTAPHCSLSLGPYPRPTPHVERFILYAEVVRGPAQAETILQWQFAV